MALLIEAEQARSQLEHRLDLLQFSAYLRRRWTFVAISVLAGAALALVGSMAITKRYSATASILIEPPAGNDPRAATAVSPVYLESLKTYEHFAESNTLFAEALIKLNLRNKYAGKPLENLKRKVLRVSKPLNTKILEISATLDDPQQALALANYIAKQTVDLNRSLDRDSEHDLTEHARRSLADATDRLKRAETARDEFLASNPIEVLEDEVRNGTELRARFIRELSEAREDLAQYSAQLQSGKGQSGPTAEDELIPRQLAGLKARISTIEKEESELGKTIAARAILLEQRKHRREALDIERQAAHAEYESANTKKNDILSYGGFRGERLAIIDPGTLPERPSSPNIPVNVAVAAVLAFAAALVYLSLSFGYLKLRNDS